MLSRAYLSLPKQALSKERFEMPKIESHIQGKKTLVNNFSQVAKALGREEKYIFKYITQEIGTAATISEGKLVLNGKFTHQQVSNIFMDYAKQYLLCHECNRPDTHFIDQHGVKMLKCDACGAIFPVKRI